MSSPFPINCAFLNTRPTGLMTYTRELVPHLGPPLLPPPLCLSARPLGDAALYPVPANMTADEGSRGHLRRLLWTQWRLPRLYRQLGAELLFSPVPEAPLGTPCRFVVTVHDSIPLRFPTRSPLTYYNRFYVPRVLAAAELILCNSEATARDAVDFFGVPPQKLRPIPLACGRDFRPLPVEPGNFFLYLGRHDPHKNLQRLLRAFARLPGERELWLAGTGDRHNTPVLRDLATELGVGERVRWLDYVAAEDLPVLLNRAIALVFPSLWEGFGLPVLEAMACGTPVITSNCSSLPEVAGDAAWLVDPQDIAAIAEAMGALARDRCERERLRECGLRRAAQFRWERTGRATAEAIAPLL